MNASRDFDKRTQSSDLSFMHSMRSPGQSIADSIRATGQFINSTLGDACNANKIGNRMLALKLLGEAMHPIMDYSSPMHTDKSGSPKEWNPWWPFGHSPAEGIGSETGMDVTHSMYMQQRKLLSEAYDKVFGSGCGCRN